MRRTHLFVHQSRMELADDPSFHFHLPAISSISLLALRLVLRAAIAPVTEIAVVA